MLGEVVRVLKNGGLVLHPTETCYGLAVDIFNEEALLKLYEFKEMSMDKPVSILVDSMEMAQEYGQFSKFALELAHRYWPGPLSIVVPRTEKLPEFLNPGERFISMRWPGHDFCVGMVRELGNPVTTTSANIHGMPQLYEADLSVFGEKSAVIDFVVDGGRIDEKLPSTLIKIDGEKVEILRQGEVEIDESYLA